MHPDFERYVLFLNLFTKSLYSVRFFFFLVTTKQARVTIIFRINTTYYTYIKYIINNAFCKRRYTRTKNARIHILMKPFKFQSHTLPYKTILRCVLK